MASYGNGLLGNNALGGMVDTTNAPPGPQQGGLLALMLRHMAQGGQPQAPQPAQADPEADRALAEMLGMAQPMPARLQSQEPQGLLPAYGRSMAGGY